MSDNEEMVLETGVDRRKFLETGLKKYFDAALRYEASDLILRGGQTARLRLRGALKSLEGEIDGEEFEKWIQDAVSEQQYRTYLTKGSLDLGFELDDENRFRVNIFRTRGLSAIAARRVSAEILDFESLHLPPTMQKVAELHQGMVLLCGITGSGKSTTIASMLQYINKHRNCHVVTIEDPIEYLFKSEKAMINQREIGIDVPDFGTALRALVRENPDVVLIGEMRDKETFEAAIQAAETGHLVLGTIHASSAPQAFSRIYDLYEANEQANVRNMLGYQMQAFIYQKLLPTLHEDIPRVPAVEILLQSPATRKYILEGREGELTEVIKSEREHGMQTLNDSLVELVEKEYVHPKVAAAATPNPAEVKMRLKGIKTG
jgi:twitching motility protein PilT